ncbi:MAG: hypothetical protein Q8N55_00115, partial [bacterium]|nr:hypothetical protein [bacterium]
MSNISIQDVVEIGSDLYAKNQEALQSLLEELKKQSYEVKDCNDSKKDARRDKPSREVQEQQGWTLWFATLGEPAYQRVGKCDSCGSYIAIAGIQSHKHKCEVCGAYTFLEFFDGTIVKFSFYSTEEQSLFPPCLRMRVYDYDEEAECLFLYPTPEKGRGLFELSTEKAEQILEENEDKLTRIERDGKDLLSVPYTLDWNKKNEVIDVSDISGYKRNYKIVKLFKGKEYGELEKLPVPESYSIFEAWHWVPLTSSPTLYERIIGAACMV